MIDNGPCTSFSLRRSHCQLALQEELAAQAAEKQQAVGRLQEQVSRLQEQVVQAQGASSPAQVQTRLHTHTHVCKADNCLWQLNMLVSSVHMYHWDGPAACSLYVQHPGE